MLRSCASTSAPEPKEVAKAAEDVLELGEDRRIDARRARADAGHGRVTESIVPRALVPIGEHRVRLGRLLEPLLRRLVAGIAIGMVLERELPIGALDVLVARVSRNAEHRVVIALAHDAFATLTTAGRSSRSPSL